MRSSLLFDTLVSLYKTLTPTMIEGAPGGGKTSLVKAVAKHVGVQCRLVHMPTRLVEDFGVPTFDGGSDTMNYKLPDWFPKQGQPGTERGGILLFDDRSQANADLQKVLANIILERELHGHKLADGWHIISTGNRQSDRAGANRTLSHLADREVTLEYDVNVKDWTKWALENDVIPLVVSFIQFRTGLLHSFDPRLDKNATPRGWERLSTIWDSVPTESRYEVAKGTVGEGAAAEFTGFVKIFEKLPNIDYLLMNPDTAEVPADVATLYAIAGSIADRATDGNFDRVVRYATRMPPEFSVLTVNLSVQRNRDLARINAFNKWAIDHQDVLL